MQLASSAKKLSSTGRLVRHGVEWLAALAIAALLLETFFVDGWLVPNVVSSGSMAPALLGPHRVARCSACGIEFSCDADAPLDAAAVCPNCGWPENSLDPRIVAGDRLLVDRATLGLPGVRRWDVVVFRDPENARALRVKRVVGLPGESVEIRDGDVYVDGAIARKTLAQQRAMAIAVDDSRWSDPKMPPRWQGEPTGSWEHAGAEFQHPLHPKTPPAANTADGLIDWLTYVHWQRAAGSPAVSQETPVRDADPYNPATSRQLNDVTDLMLVARLTVRGGGDLLLRASDGRATFQIDIQPQSGQVSLLCDDQQVASARGTRPLANRQIEIILSTFDRQLLLAVDGRVEVCHEYEPAAGPLRAVARPLAIGVRALEVEIQRLAVYRDVYYTPPTHANGRAVRQLGPEEYFVLGDNSPVSVDSRDWMGGEMVAAGLLVGRPLLPRRGF